MNIVLFEPSEIGPALATSDNRYRHIKKVLRRDVGDSFDVGKINGPRGKALITKSDREGLHLQITWDRPHQPGSERPVLADKRWFFSSPNDNC